MTDETRRQTKDAAATHVPADPAARSGSGKQMFRQPGLSPDTVLADRFRIVRFIARGGMGEVYEAEDRDVEKALATARSLAARSQNDGLRREVLLASAALRGAQGDAAGAAKALQEASARARQKGLVAWPLDARLLEGQILVTGSAKEPARSLLADVEKDAGARGFRRIARKASEARGA